MIENDSIDTASSQPLEKRSWKKLSFLGNKYFISSLLFLIWMLFFNEKDIITEFRRKDKLNELQKSEQHLNEVIIETKQELGQLKNNAQTIEKYAREKYMMKKDNEDLFIISPSDSLK
jgi:cell division protein FtsB